MEKDLQKETGQTNKQKKKVVKTNTENGWEEKMGI